MSAPLTGGRTPAGDRTRQAKHRGCGAQSCMCRSQGMVYNYDEEEWAKCVPKDAEWGRPETDYLIRLCQQFDLRFLVVADRYEARLVLAPAAWRLHEWGHRSST